MRCGVVLKERKGERGKKPGEKSGGGGRLSYDAAAEM